MTAALDRAVANALGLKSVNNCEKWGKTMDETQPAQEPIAYVTGTYNGMFVVAPLNPAMVLPVGMALYTTPQPQRTEKNT